MFHHKDYIILGAGPSGLSFAHQLILNGVPKNRIIILEKENVPGGLCRSEVLDDYPVDIGGGHFLDIKLENVLKFLFNFMPENEWKLHDRKSQIHLSGHYIDHPLEANIWQLEENLQIDYLESIAQAGCVSGNPMPSDFASWVKWKLGDRIANNYMLPYNRKIWSMELNELGTYWLYKLPDVSFRETLQSCLQKKASGKLPAHGKFLYPNEYGYGEVWRRMGEYLEESLILNCPIEHIDLNTLTVNHQWSAKKIITTIPWTFFPNICNTPREISNSIDKLKYVSIDVDYHSKSLDSNAHWIYEPDLKIPYHRMLLRSNFISGARGFWTECNSKRSIDNGRVRFHNEFAYPVNTLHKPETVEKILSWGMEKGIYGLGRWGRWEHMNSDIAVSEALQLANEFTNN